MASAASAALNKNRRASTIHPRHDAIGAWARMQQVTAVCRQIRPFQMHLPISFRDSTIISTSNVWLNTFKHIGPSSDDQYFQCLTEYLHVWHFHSCIIHSSVVFVFMKTEYHWICRSKLRKRRIREVDQESISMRTHLCPNLVLKHGRLRNELTFYWDSVPDRSHRISLFV